MRRRAGVIRRVAARWLYRAARCLSRAVALAVLIAPGACTPTSAPVVLSGGPREESVYVTGAGWHTGLAVPAEALRGRVAGLRESFPAVRYLSLGWGERAYFMAADPDTLDALRALFPGPAVLLVSPVDTFASSVRLRLTHDELERLAAYLARAFDTSQTGSVHPLGGGPQRGSVFYAATGTYSASDTCNTWVAEALAASGLPVKADGVVFAGQVMEQVQRLQVGGDQGE